MTVEPRINEAARPLYRLWVNDDQFAIYGANVLLSGVFDPIIRSLGA